MISHNRPTIGAEELAAAQRVIASGNLAQGNEVRAFEDELCEYLGLEQGHAVAVSSGSSALYLSIRALENIIKINNVAIPAYSCSALRNAVLLAEKRPQYVDVCTDSPNMDMNSDLVHMSDAVIACHMYGHSEVLEGENIIEDCAQAMGAAANQKPVGTQTKIAVFSFYATKPMTSGGEGGAVVSRDSSLIEHIKDIRDFDMKNDSVIRFNFKMTDLQACIGRVQLKKMDDFVQKRRYLADRYEQNGIHLWRKKGGLDYRGLIRSNNQNKLIKFLEENGVRSIIPIEEQELLCGASSVPNAYKLTQSLVSIPLYPSLSEEEQDKVISLLKQYQDKEGEL